MQTLTRRSPVIALLPDPDPQTCLPDAPPPPAAPAAASYAAADASLQTHSSPFARSRDGGRGGGAGVRGGPRAVRRALQRGAPLRRP